MVLLDALSFLALSWTENIWGAVAAFMLGFSMNTLIVFSLDEILKIFSKDPAIGKIRGIYLVICNLGWIFAQLLSGTFLGGFSFRTIYFVGFSIMMLFFLVSLLNLKNIPDPDYDKIKSVKYVKGFFKNKNLFRAYGLSFLLQFFYCWMVVYTPIYLYAHLGFSWKEIGLMFAIMLLPFILVPFRAGKYADKIGERKILMFGFAVAALATFSLFFVREHSLWVWAILLFTTRVGAATIEVMSDAYFFKHIKSENDEFVGVYRSASPIAYIIGPVVAFAVFSFIPSFQFIYIILGTLMLYGVYLSSTIRKSDI
ncbi:MAG: Major facilitator superfamily (MFS) protein [Candidatus Nomurabacteria bacterium GW2011_GWF2_43_8]|nr:MAG: Major facilitator superfamily (MFS) protein [Candidatus Nomurabacteria bacterium GW2011_GWF2_43_8]